ncbi:DUF3221 domain-containing protein [Psychrobacillus glaciei]|uniref:DUF3221 domain-containing protein n=1 Tax=Psychrobacillus glaciei TaxID=2283160 RepID=A0A5J6SRM6_9BACI|nr:YobA family protein [Psychrobacillus glaciei]QFG00591.1 DUF3221 domain-containing protein [Psychrobacillus glaciei]
MKGKYTVFIILAVILIAIGATFYFVMQFFENNPTQPQPIGYRTGVIVEMKDNSILVVSDISDEEARNLSVDEAMDTGKDATWFSLTMDQRNQLKLYDEVKVGYEALDESFPAQGSAKTVEKLNE